MVSPMHLIAHQVSPGVRISCRSTCPRKLTKDGVNRSVIKLIVMDFYTAEAWRTDARKLVPEAVRRQVKEEVHAEDLQDVFAEMTGRYTRL